MKDGRLRITLKVADTDELVGWLLSFGSQVKVVAPESLRTRVRDEARRIIAIHGDKTKLIPVERIERSILLIRGSKVMLDTALAHLYGVPTKF